MPTDRARRRAGHFIGVARLQLFDDREAGFALDQREHAMPHVAAHHRVAFPMSDALSVRDLSRPLGDAALARQDAP